MGHLSEKEKQNALNEVRILASIHNPNIVSYYDAFIDEPSQCLCIIMEYADNGDLFQLICQNKKAGTLIPESLLWNIFLQVVRGLKTLHFLGIMHRDLKVGF